MEYTNIKVKRTGELQSFGVNYREDKYSAPGWSVFRYRWFNVPTGKNGTKFISVLGGAKEFVTLLQYWNNDYFIYAPVLENVEYGS